MTLSQCSSIGQERVLLLFTALRRDEWLHLTVAHVHCSQFIIVLLFHGQLTVTRLLFLSSDEAGHSL